MKTGKLSCNPTIITFTVIVHCLGIAEVFAGKRPPEEVGLADKIMGWSRI